MKRQWARDELADHWTLRPKELELLANKSGATRLGFAVLLKAFTLEGRFPRQKHDVPGVVIVHVANQVNVPADLYPRYEWSSRTIEYHRAQIRDFLGFREATVQDGNELVVWLVEQVLPHEPRDEHVREAVFERCRALRIEPSSSGRIDRLVGSAFHNFEERWCAAAFGRLDVATQRALDDLLTTGGADDGTDAEATETRRSGLNELKADAGAISLESVLVEIAKLERLRSLGLPTDVFGDVAPKVVERFRQRAATEAPSELRAHAPALRATLVAALCWLRQREVTDSLVDLLIQIIHKINVRAEKRVEKELMDDLTRVTGKVSVLFHIAEASVEQPDGRVRDVVFPAAGGEQKLRDLVREYKSSGPAFRFRVHTYLRASYASHYRRMVPHLLQALEFCSNNATHRPLIEALELLERYANSSQRLYPVREKVPLQGVVPPPTPERIERLVRSALASHEQQVSTTVRGRLSTKSVEALDGLLMPAKLSIADGELARAPLVELKTDPARPGWTACSPRSPNCSGSARSGSRQTCSRMWRPERARGSASECRLKSPTNCVGIPSRCARRCLRPGPRFALVS